jgi:hypothetical protein
LPAASGLACYLSDCGLRALSSGHLGQSCGYVLDSHPRRCSISARVSIDRLHRMSDYRNRRIDHRGAMARVPPENAWHIRCHGRADGKPQGSARSMGGWIE